MTTKTPVTSPAQGNTKKTRFKYISDDALEGAVGGAQAAPARRKPDDQQDVNAAVGDAIIIGQGDDMLASLFKANAPAAASGPQQPRGADTAAHSPSPDGTDAKSSHDDTYHPVINVQPNAEAWMLWKDKDAKPGAGETPAADAQAHGDGDNAHTPLEPTPPQADAHSATPAVHEAAPPQSSATRDVAVPAHETPAPAHSTEPHDVQEQPHDATPAAPPHAAPDASAHSVPADDAGPAHGEASEPDHGHAPQPAHDTGTHTAPVAEHTPQVPGHEAGEAPSEPGGYVPSSGPPTRGATEATVPAGADGHGGESPSGAPVYLMPIDQPAHFDPTHAGTVTDNVGNGEQSATLIKVGPNFYTSASDALKADPSMNHWEFYRAAYADGAPVPQSRITVQNPPPPDDPSFAKWHYDHNQAVVGDAHDARVTLTPQGEALHNDSIQSANAKGVGGAIYTFDGVNFTPIKNMDPDQLHRAVYEYDHDYLPLTPAHEQALREQGQTTNVLDSQRYEHMQSEDSKMGEPARAPQMEPELEHDPAAVRQVPLNPGSYQEVTHAQYVNDGDKIAEHRPLGDVTGRGQDPQAQADGAAHVPTIPGQAEPGSAAMRPGTDTAPSSGHDATLNQIRQHIANRLDEGTHSDDTDEPVHFTDEHSQDVMDHLLPDGDSHAGRRTVADPVAPSHAQDSPTPVAHDGRPPAHTMDADDEHFVPPPPSEPPPETPQRIFAPPPTSTPPAAAEGGEAIVIHLGEQGPIEVNTPAHPGGDPSAPAAADHGTPAEPSQPAAQAPHEPVQADDTSRPVTPQENQPAGEHESTPTAHAGAESNPVAHEGATPPVRTTQSSPARTAQGVIDDAYRVLDERPNPIRTGDQIGHVTNGIPDGEEPGGHAVAGTNTSHNVMVNAAGVTARADALAQAEAGYTVKAGPLTGEVDAKADARASGAVHIGKGGIDVTGQAAVEASVSAGVAVSGGLGHGVSGSVGVEDTAEAHAQAGGRIGTSGIEGAVAAGATNTTAIGAGLTADLGKGISLSNEIHAGVVETATAAGHAGVGMDGFGMGSGAVAGSYENIGGSITVGNDHYSGTAGGDLHGPGAFGFSEDASANFHDGKVTLNLSGDIDLGLVGFNFHLGTTLDVAGVEHSAEHAIASAASDLGGYVKEAAVTVEHAFVTAGKAIEHGFEDAGNAIVKWFRSW